MAQRACDRYHLPGAEAGFRVDDWPDERGSKGGEVLPRKQVLRIERRV